MAKFTDTVTLQVKAGKGGPGSVHFHREKFVAKGGPDGGDGGDGGSVFIRIHPQLYNLDHLNPHQKYHAEPGDPGTGQKKYGRKGEDLIINLPPGVVVKDEETQEIILDADAHFFVTEDKLFLVCKGGKGGLGNVHFTSSVNQAPEYAQPGLPGEERILHIDLKLIADIGFVGLPNAGKSTLLSKLTAAQPKIADYPFTTLIPQLGTLTIEAAYGPVVFKLADIPGIIEGAHKGSGLGLSFLQHIERVRLILYLLSFDMNDPVYALRILREELASYNADLLDRPSLIVINKIDQIPLSDREEIQQLYIEELYKILVAPTTGRKFNHSILFISALAEEGLDSLKKEILNMMTKQDL